MADFGSTTVSIDDLRAGHVTDCLTDADVVIAVDVSTHEEEVVRGQLEWERASDTGQEEDLVVLRVELDADSGDLEWLVDAVEAIECGDVDASEEDGEDDEGDY
jgi:hypothetical protein